MSHSTPRPPLLLRLPRRRRKSSPPPLPPGDPPILRPLQPVPRFVLTSTINGVTAITRVWNEGDIPHCRLCHSCKAHEGVCQIAVNGVVPAAAAATFNARDLERRPPMPVGGRTTPETSGRKGGGL